MKRWKRVAIGLACCMAFAGCSTQDSSSAAGLDPAACERSCDEAYDKCAYSCMQKIDNQMCAQECIDMHESCKKRCG